MDFNELSYNKQSKSFSEYVKGGKKEDVAKTWFMKDKLVYDTIEKRNKIVDPLLITYPDSKWFTVGDGRFGTDASYLFQKGFDITATDIDESLLKEGLERGLIGKYKVENAEYLSFNDNEFDFALCKEAYHHFPRPMKALYELLRVARKGVVLLEPVDQYIYSGFVSMFSRKLIHLLDKLCIFKLLLGKNIKRHTYEEVGNYVFKLSVREVEKVALGLNYPCYAYKPINVLYIKGIEFQQKDKISFLTIKYKLFNTLQNFLTKINFIEPSLISVIIFKENPSAQCIDSLKKDSYKIAYLPENPYLK
ncbi:MAG: class I SAM-dependent methyltransferase [Bacteroidota bacterium]|nr:class I SAM-dependent methyltransferase [Bacteroidota bacterium]